MLRKQGLPLLFLQGEPRSCERIWGMVGRFRYRAKPASGWAHLEELSREAPIETVVLVDPYHGSKEGPAEELWQYLSAFPSVSVVALISEIRPHDLRLLGEWGVADILSFEIEDTPHLMSTRVESVRGRSVRARIARSLPEQLSASARTLVDAAAEVVAYGGGTRDLARALAVSRSTLLRRCARAGLPPPKRLLVWLRILYASALLEDNGRTVTNVARSVGYGAPSTLSRALRRSGFDAPKRLRDGRGFERVLSGLFASRAMEGAHDG